MARAHKVIDERPPVTVSSDEAVELLRLTKDVRALWAAPATTNEDRKRLLRTVLSRVVVLAVTEAAFDIEVIWVGGHRGADVGAAALTKMTQHQLMFEGAVTRAFNAQGPDQSRILGAARAVYTTVQTALASTDATHPVAPILSTNRSALKDTWSASMIMYTH